MPCPDCEGWKKGVEQANRISQRYEDENVRLRGRVQYLEGELLLREQTIRAMKGEKT